MQKYKDTEFAESRNWESKEEFEAAYLDRMEEKHGALGPIALMIIQIVIELLWRRINAS